MTLRCPRKNCRQAFTNYVGCAALTCSRATCGCGFCAYCLADCGTDAHDHCIRVHGGWGLTKAGFDELQRKRRVGKLDQYWRNLPEELREALSNNNSVLQHFEDLRMPAPGRAGRAAVQFAQELAHLRGMGLVADAADENEAARVLELVGGDVARAAVLLLG